MTTTSHYQTKYSDFTKRLTEVKQAPPSGTVITALDSQSVTLEQKYQVYQKSMDQLNLTLGDLKSVDCINEPDGFKATLDDARAQLKAVQANRQDVSKFVQESMVATLKTLKVSSGEKQ